MRAVVQLAVMIAAALPAAEVPQPAFSLHLPSVKLGYPGSEYWAEIQRPDGKQMEAFAVFAGRNCWTVPLRPDLPGNYRLLRLQKRQGDRKEEITWAQDSELQLTVKSAQPSLRREQQTLVSAGAFTTFFAAKQPWCINDHTLVQGPDRHWHLFGITHPKPLDFFRDPGRRLAHATAASLLEHPWQAQSPAVTADWECYREYLLWAPHVIRHRDTYHMFVCVGDKETHRYRLHLLTSPNLKVWTRHPDNPLVADGFDGRDPMVLPLNDRWALYYTATTTPEGGNHIVACVTSTDLVHWSDRKVALIHPRAGTFGGPTESPFVVQRGRHYYLFVCDNAWTDVLLSLDPFHWDYERRVGRIEAHAAEIVRDADGSWHITHAGWMNGPVRLAPLHWRDGLDDAPASIAPANR